MYLSSWDAAMIWWPSRNSKNSSRRICNFSACCF